MITRFKKFTAGKTQKLVRIHHEIIFQKFRLIFLSVDSLELKAINYFNEMSRGEIRKLSELGTVLMIQRAWVHVLLLSFPNLSSDIQFVLLITTVCLV